MGLEERIFKARRAGCREALMSAGLTPEEAEHWCDAWEAEATRRGIPGSGDFWQDGRRWIDAHRTGVKSPAF